MAYVRDNLVRSAGGMKGVYAQVTVSGAKATFDTGFSTINHVTWDTSRGVGGGYDFINSKNAPNYNGSYFNTPTFNNGTLELTGSIVTDGTTVQFWAIGE